MPEQKFWTHEAIVDHAELLDGDTLLDLGCGSGHTLVTAAGRHIEAVRLVGLDVDSEALGVAGARLLPTGVTFQLVQADLSQRLPLRAGSVTKVVSHDVLEWLPDPMALLAEAARVMREGAVSVWSHTDYDSAVINGADRELTRRVVHAYADAPQGSAPHSDGQMGRRLAGIVRRSLLDVLAVEAYVLLRTDLSGPARLRIEDMMSVLRGAVAAGNADVTVEELDQWLASLVEADRRGDFFYSQTAYMVVAKKGP